MTLIRQIAPFALALLAIVALIYGVELARTFGSSTPGVPTAVAIATTTSVGPQANVTIFAANQTCTSRIISTQAQPIMLIFADPTNGDLSSTTLSQTKGSIQAASTTVAYDSGLYGCGRMVGYAAASTTITALETR